ncbi:MAG: tail fiber domain-containing protein, partial [Candidatus Binatia bacterium]
CSAIVVCSLFALCPPAARAQKITPSASQGGVSWQVNIPNDGVSLRVSQPNGIVFERNFPSGQSPAFTSPAGVLPDGSYTYELHVSAALSPELRAQAKAASADAGELAGPSGLVESGSFRVVGGVVKVPDASASEPKVSSSSRSTPAVPEDTFNDVIVQALNTRILFDDTSGAGFPANDWEIDINDSVADGVDRFSIRDFTGGTTPFTIRGAAPTDSLFIASNGNVGMGTAVPARELHIVQNAVPTIRLEQTFSGLDQIWDIRGNSSTGFSIIDDTASLIPFVIESGTGNVGIGTTIPAGRLHVRGAGAQLSIFQSSDNNAVQFRLQTNSINRRFVALNTAGAQQSQLLFGDNGAFDFLGPTAADVRMRLLANGNVGIGTTAPTQKLSVNGSAGKPGGGSWATFSDERLKNIKGEFTSGLDAVMRLHPIRYEYKADNAIGIQSEGEHIGFGASAVSEVIPEAVTRDEAGYLMIDNDPILWTMLNAIKEQNSQMNGQDGELRAEIKQLKEQNNEFAQLKAENRQIVEQLKQLQAQVVLQAENRKLPRKQAVAKANR